MHVSSSRACGSCNVYVWVMMPYLICVGSIENSEVPFTSMLSSDHASIEEMKGIVCTKKLRPPLAEHWNLDEVI